MGLNQTKELLHSKDTGLKSQLTEWEKIFASYSSDKELIPRIYREHKNLTPKELTPQ
jgi:hypothetical protein